MAAGMTYFPIATTTLGSGAADITFSSISASYTDLVLIVNGTPVTAGSYNLEMRFNGDTASNYSRTVLSGDGSAASSSRNSSQTKIVITSEGNLTTTSNNQIINIFNYSNSTTYKTVLARGNRANAGLDATVGLWRSTAAITSIVIYLTGSNLATGTSATLYGIAAA
jgi:hypothetical protein